MATRVEKLDQFSDKTIYIKNIYNPYRKGFDMNTKKFRTFKQFPVEGQDGKLEWKEQIWNDETKQMDFIPVTQKLDKSFYQTFKKHFDMEFILETPSTVVKYFSKKDNQDVVVENERDIIFALPAGKLKNIIQSVTEYTENNPTIVTAFDWEDEARNELKGLFVKISITGKSSKDFGNGR